MKFYTGVFSFVLIILFQINTFSQIPNAGFEEWIDDNTPQSWISNSIPTLWTTVVKSNTAHTGSFAVRLQVADIGGSALAPIIQSNFFPINQSYGSLTGYYQFQPSTASEVIDITTWLVVNSNLVAFGTMKIGSAASGYTQFSMPIEYFGTGNPDTAYIWIAIYDTSDNDPVSGAFALIDDLSFGPSTSVQEINAQNPRSFNLTQNYPNPFNPSTKINFSLSEQSYVELIVYDLLGREVEILVNDNYNPGTYSVDFDADNLPNGIYIAKMNAGKYSKAIKMTLLK